jgi:N-methylhydantoinase A/oxoprolinase/acetone carboxylase beta subunit
MTVAIRVVSIERGHHPRDLYSSRLAAPARCMAAHLARLVGIKTVLVPPALGVTRC